jgi:hypothetical protein
MFFLVATLCQFNALTTLRNDSFEKKILVKQKIYIAHVLQ